jgi:hypothetical protein
VRVEKQGAAVKCWARVFLLPPLPPSHPPPNDLAALFRSSRSPHSLTLPAGGDPYFGESRPNRQDPVKTRRKIGQKTKKRTE